MKYIFFLVGLITISCNKPLVSEPPIPTTTYIKNIYKYIDYKKDNSSNIVFYIDLSRKNNTYRFFVINLKDTTIINQGLCCNGKTDDNDNVIYSNIIGSNCSSKGLYKIGNSYTGRFGKAYVLHGLSSTNSNAQTRHVVLHSYRFIPREPSFYSICKSQGCPTVNPDYLNELNNYIKNYKVKYLIID